MALFDVLSGMDAQFVYWDNDRTPMVMGNLCIFEGGPLHDESGAFRLAEVRRAISSRLHLVPRYRRKLLTTRWSLAHPVLVDDPDFDIAEHVRLVTLPAPGSREQLKEAFARVHEGVLDHSRPLWEITFIDGLEDGTVGMAQKIHHAPFDGSSTVDIMDLLFQGTPDGEPPPWQPQPPPDGLTLLGAMSGQQVSKVWDRVNPRQIPQLPRRLGEIPGVVRSLVEIGRPPRTSLNAPIGPRRRFDWVPTTLETARTIRGLVPGCTVNDVMLAVVAGGLRELLLSRGEDVADLMLRVMVPVSVRTTSGATDAGNQISAFFAPLPVCQPDGLRRLQLVHRSTRRLKDGKQARGIQMIMDSAEYLPSALTAAAGRTVIQAGSAMNLTVTNVPGPRTELRLLGARMLELNPMVPIGNRLTLNVAVESYLDKLTIGLSADADRHPDLPLLRDAIARGLDELAARARGTGPN